MNFVLAFGATLLLAACVPAPVRPVQPQPVNHSQDAPATMERERVAREEAELKRREAEARQPVAGKISSRPSIAAQTLQPDPTQSTEERGAPVQQPVTVPKAIPQPELAMAKPSPRPKVAPAKVDYATMAWQLSSDLRKLQSHPDVQTFYNERGWVVSLPAEALFEPGETSIKAGEQETLDSLARVLRHYVPRGILMDGPQVERAQQIRRALAERGIPEQAITANGVGERLEFVVPLSRLNAGAGR